MYVEQCLDVREPKSGILCHKLKQHCSTVAEVVPSGQQGRNLISLYWRRMTCWLGWRNWMVEDQCKLSTAASLKLDSGWRLSEQHFQHLSLFFQCRCSSSTYLLTWNNLHFFRLISFFSSLALSYMFFCGIMADCPRKRRRSSCELPIRSQAFSSSLFFWICSIFVMTMSSSSSSFFEAMRRNSASAWPKWVDRLYSMTKSYASKTSSHLLSRFAEWADMPTFDTKNDKSGLWSVSNRKRLP